MIMITSQAFTTLLLFQRNLWFVVILDHDHLMVMIMFTALHRMHYCTAMHFLVGVDHETFPSKKKKYTFLPACHAMPYNSRYSRVHDHHHLQVLLKEGRYKRPEMRWISVAPAGAVVIFPSSFSSSLYVIFSRTIHHHHPHNSHLSFDTSTPVTFFLSNILSQAPQFILHIYPTTRPKEIHYLFI